MLYDGVISHILEKFSMLSTRYTFKIRVFDTQYIPIERQLLRKGNTISSFHDQFKNDIDTLKYLLMPPKQLDLSNTRIPSL